MRLELLVGSNDPFIYPIDKSKILIGSSDTCDLVLPTSGVSRKHLLIIAESDSYFVADQGSTNGTFMNEERLVPGRRVEFTSFFPVRLGDDVLVSLIGDEEETGFTNSSYQAPLKEERTNPSFDFDSTKVLSLQDLGIEQTEDLVKRRQEKRNSLKKQNQSKQKVPVKRKRKRSSIPAFAFIAFGGAALYQFYFKEPASVLIQAPIAKVGEIRVNSNDQRTKELQNVPLIASSDLMDKASFSALIKDIKCTTDLEKYLCETIAASQRKEFGVVQVGTMLNVFTDISTYYEEAKNHIRKPVFERPEAQEQVLAEYEKELIQLGAFLFVVKGIPKELDYEMLKNYKLTFAFYHSTSDQEHPRHVLAVLPEALKKFKSKNQLKRLKFVKKIGVKALQQNAHFFREY